MKAEPGDAQRHRRQEEGLAQQPKEQPARVRRVDVTDRAGLEDRGEAEHHGGGQRRGES
jgi:hypothetical protein